MSAAPFIIKAFDESKHPRQPAGDETGGQFAVTGGGGIEADAVEFDDSGNPKSGTDINRYWWHEAKMDKWRQGLTTDELEARNQYIGLGYHEFNKALRKGSANPEIMRNVRTLAKSLKPLNENAIVYRGINGEVPEIMKTGAIIRDRAFVSTSLDKQIALRFSKSDTRAVARIRVPAGTRVGYANHSEEREIILSPGSKFKILKIEGRGSSGKWYNQVDMELIPHRKKKKAA